MTWPAGPQRKPKACGQAARSSIMETSWRPNQLQPSATASVRAGDIWRLGADRLRNRRRKSELARRPWRAGGGGEHKQREQFVAGADSISITNCDYARGRMRDVFLPLAL